MDDLIVAHLATLALAEGALVAELAELDARRLITLAQLAGIAAQRAAISGAAETRTTSSGTAAPSDDSAEPIHSSGPATVHGVDTAQVTRTSDESVTSREGAAAPLPAPIAEPASEPTSQAPDAVGEGAQALPAFSLAADLGEGGDALPDRPVSQPSSGTARRPKASLTDAIRGLAEANPEWTAQQVTDHLRENGYPKATYGTVTGLAHHAGITFRKVTGAERVAAMGPTLKDALIDLAALHPDWTLSDATAHVLANGWPETDERKVRSLCRVYGIEFRKRLVGVASALPITSPPAELTETERLAEERADEGPPAEGATQAGPPALQETNRTYPSGTRFRLRSADGKYLHESCFSLTTNLAYAWCQPESKLLAVRRKFELARDLIEEAVPPQVKLSLPPVRTFA